PFVKPHRQGWVIHDIVREMISENIRQSSPADFSKYHQRAAAYYALSEEKQSQGLWNEAIDLLRLEQLYHSIFVDERNGMLRFQKLAETFASRFQVGRLQALLEDVNSYLSCLKQPNSRLWQKYYGAWLKHQKGLYTEAEPIYQEVEENRDAEQKLRAYA